ncbi:MAG: GGDEF domain-containing phosphodiesterase [Ruthenibacterium sp.]
MINQSGKAEMLTEGTPQNGFCKSSIQYVFEALYHSKNSVEAIHHALALVARHFSFERGYIFETSDDEKTTSNTFEWCAKGVSAERDHLQNVPIAAVSTANASFQKNGIFVLRSLEELPPAERSVLQPQGIQSMFQFGIFDKKRLIGFIGFDNCTGDALRNDAELEEIATICNILATFFVKQRIDAASAQNIQFQLEVMNHLNNYVYVINPKTFEVIFINSQTRKVMQEAEGTLPCYQFFRGRKEQCPDCPLKRLQDGMRQVTCEIYNEKLEIWLETSASALLWTDGSPAYLIECADITKQKGEHLLHIHQLEELAFVDELTKSRTFYKFKEDAQEILTRQHDIDHFFVKLDIENFKLINQIYGYEKGDEILCCVARAIQETTRNADEIFARISNDEFIALFAMQGNTTIQVLYDVFTSRFHALLDENLAFKFTFACGIYAIPKSDVQKPEINHLFEKVNMAHKTAKFNKTGKIVAYDEAMTEKAMHSKEIENKMANALQSDEFVVYLQPKYYLKSEKIGGAEALTRWQNENSDLFYPDVFIPVFERNGFITKLDFQVLYKVCCILKSWIANGIEPVVVSVNFSRLHLSNRNFVKELCSIVDNVGISRGLIEIEITETAIYDNIDALSEILTDLHKSGFTMSMDDFGSGYSSLGLLKDLPVDIIKMDRSFFVNQKDEKRSKIVVGSIIKMAEELGIRIVAEGVESQKHIDLLRELDCDMVQGYYYARPMPAKKFTELIRKQANDKRDGEISPSL